MTRGAGLLSPLRPKRSERGYAIGQRVMRHGGYLVLGALLLAGGGMTASLNTIVPVQQQAVEQTAEQRTEPLASAEPNLQNESEPAASEPRSTAVSAPAQATTEAQQAATATSQREQQSEPAPQLEASASAEPPAELAFSPAPSELPPAAVPPFATPASPEPVAPAEPPANSMQLAALTPPAAAPAEPARPQPLSLGDVTRIPEMPLPRARPAELTSDATKLAADLFSQIKLPSAGSAQVVGFYSAGCIMGAQQLAQQGRYWQVMRPSRNRYWGHPELIAFIERVAHDVVAQTGWPGILIGDMAQPRGGPLPAGHASHQVGLDVDIWLKPMPKEPYTAAETETVPMVSAVAADNKQLDKNVWQADDASMIKIAAKQPEVDRIFINPVIKKELCRTKSAADESWIAKVRPWYGHDEHMHVRLKCPPGSPVCRDQPAAPEGDGCGKALDHWFTASMLATQQRIRTQAPVKRNLKMAALPAGCLAVLQAPAVTNQIASGGTDIRAGAQVR